jgi:hypothetical protein
MEQATIRQPNQTIPPWKKGDMKLTQLGNNYSGSGSIEFWWSPVPGYYFTFQFKNESENQPHRGEAILTTSEGDDVPVEVRWIKGDVDLECKGPLRTQIRQGNLADRIDDLCFCISNFYINPLNPFILKYKEWEVLLLPDKDIHDLFKNLDENGGYAFTYRGHIRYMGGTLFSLTAVESLLEPLRVFLSFVRGAWCNMFFFQGTANEKHIVAIHPNPLLPPSIPLTRWPRQPEYLVWCNNHIPRDLNEAFCRFMELYEEGQLAVPQNQVDAYNHIKSIIITYIESGLAIYGETAIVLVQSALESLTYMQAKKCLGKRCLKCFKDSSAELKIRWMLNKMSIPTDIPPEVNIIQDYLKGKGLQEPLDGPKAITYLRNGIIHASPKLLTRPIGKPTDLVPSETAMEYTIFLGRMFVELAVLSILNYNGNYINKLNGLTQQVPLKPMALSQRVLS